MIARPTGTWAEADRRTPFASAFRPWIEPAVASVRDSSCVNDSVRAALVDGLLRRLGSIGGAALLHRFRTGHHPDYERFVHNAPCVISRELPGLVSLVETACRHWVEFTTALMEWLEADMSRLGPRASSVTSVRLGLSDHHECGRTVVRVELDDGSRWALKPRPMQVDATFYELLVDFPELFDREDLPAIVVSADDTHGSHGYVQWIDPVPVVDAPRAWRGTGRMLAAMHLVGAGDMHAENMVSRGSMLVPVDVEVAGSGAEGPARTAGRRWLEDSALRTEALPDLVSGSVAVTAGALLARGGQPTGRRGTRWTDLGTDRISLERPMVVTPRLPNEPRDANGRLVPLSVDDLLRGYDEAMGALAASESPHQRFANCPSRWVVRPTVDYLRCLAAATRPDTLTSAEAVTAVHDVLPQRDPHWERIPTHLADAIETAERVALRRMDVPVFRTIGDGVYADGQRIGVVPSLGTARVRDRHANWQAVARRRAEREGIRIIVAPYAPSPADLPVDHAATVPSWDDVAVATAERIVRTFLGSELGWLTCTIAGASARPWPAVAADGLYNGSAGTAVFLSAAATAFAIDEAAHIALQCVERHPLALDDPSLGTGWSGVAWARAAVGHQLDRPDLVQRAADLIAEQIPATVERNASLELMSGWGGVVAVAASVCSRVNHRTLRSRLGMLADGYTDELDRQLNDPTTAWRLVRPGMAHGSFGITVALGWLVAALDHRASARLLDRLLDAEDERIFRDDTIGRASAEGLGQTGWCWGAAGYLLARAAPWIDSHRRDADFQRAVSELESAAPALSQLCCGRIGLVATLESVRRHHQRNGASEHGLEVAARRHWSTATQCDRAWAFEPRTDVWSPSLFRGAAGIGLVAAQRAGHSVVMPWSLLFGDEALR